MTEHRGEGHRHGQGGEEGDDIGGAERLQEPPFHPRQEEQGEKHQEDDERGKDDRGADLDTRLIHHLQGRLALVCGEHGIVAQPPKDVFHIDHGVIDQRPDGDGHPAQGHGIDRRPKRLQDEHRGEQGQGNGGERNDRRL